jgi:hypothetical protein
MIRGAFGTDDGVKKLGFQMIDDAVGIGTVQLSVATILRVTATCAYSLAASQELYNQGLYNHGGCSGLPSADGERPLNIRGVRFLSPGRMRFD